MFEDVGSSVNIHAAKLSTKYEVRSTKLKYRARLQRTVYDVRQVEVRSMKYKVEYLTAKTEGRNVAQRPGAPLRPRDLAVAAVAKNYEL